MRMRNSGALGLAIAGLVGVVTPLAAQTSPRAEPNIVAGTLSCEGSGRLGLVLGSRQRLTCSFKATGDEQPQRYAGTITRVGVDLGATGSTVMIWSVLARAPGVPRGALAGRFAGVSGSASVGVGVGANALVGGSGRNFVLQPVSVQVQTGVNLAAGVAGLRLSFLK
jgi:hypothetical protein